MLGQHALRAKKASRLWIMLGPTSGPRVSRVTCINEAAPADSTPTSRATSPRLSRPQSVPSTPHCRLALAAAFHHDVALPPTATWSLQPTPVAMPPPPPPLLRTPLSLRSRKWSTCPPEARPEWKVRSGRWDQQRAPEEEENDEESEAHGAGYSQCAG